MFPTLVLQLCLLCLICEPQQTVIPPAAINGLLEALEFIASHARDVDRNLDLRRRLAFQQVRATPLPCCTLQQCIRSCVECCRHVGTWHRPRSGSPLPLPFQLVHAPFFQYSAAIYQVTCQMLHVFVA